MNIATAQEQPVLSVWTQQGFCAHRHVQAVMLDLDGTLVDTLDDFVAAVNAAFGELGLPGVGPEEVKCRVGKGSEHLVRSLLAFVEPARSAESLNALLSTALDAYQRHYLRVNGLYSRVYDGVLEGLNAFKTAGLPLVCLTNKPTAFAVPLLEAKGLGVFFSHVYGGDAFARKKPDPLPLLSACTTLGTRPASTLMVGDSSNDAQAARAAGCPVVLVNYGYNHGQPVDEVDADAHLDSLALLPGWLASRTQHF